MCVCVCVGDGVNTFGFCLLYNDSRDDDLSYFLIDCLSCPAVFARRQHLDQGQEPERGVGDRHICHIRN